MSSMTVTAATAHTTTAAAAVTVPALTPMLSQLMVLIACENRAIRVDSARRGRGRRAGLVLCAAAGPGAADWPQGFAGDGEGDTGREDEGDGEGLGDDEEDFDGSGDDEDDTEGRSDG